MNAPLREKKIEDEVHALYDCDNTLRKFWWYNGVNHWNVSIFWKKKNLAASVRFLTLCSHALEEFLTSIQSLGCRRLNGHEGASLHKNILHSSPKEVHIDLPQFSRWPWVTDPDLGSCRFCQMVLTARPIDKIKKLGWFSSALLLEKSVVGSPMWSG